jgi:hypothetical protein
MKIEITNGVETPVTKFFSAAPDPQIIELADGLKCVLLEEYKKLERECDEARGHCESIVERANELIARWDQPSWKDTAPTARFINALRIAVRAYERTK